MLELTKTPRTDGAVRLSVTVPGDKAEAVAAALEDILRLVDGRDEPTVSAAEALPDMTPAKVLRGARGLRGLTQAKLAALLAVPKSNVSAMERGARPISREMARRLAAALAMPYKSFL